MKKLCLAGLVFCSVCLPVAAIADDAAGTRGGEPGAATRSTGEVVDDATITAKVKSAFVQDDKVSALDVKVNTYRGVVQLSGYVDNGVLRDRAADIARSVGGVKSVQNDIQVRQ